MWSGRFHAPNADGEELSDRIPSYSLQVYAPRHPNEKKQFIKKLSDAAANFRRHAKDVHLSKDARIVFARLDEQASISECDEWAREYLLRSECALTEIHLYQAAVSFEPDRTAIIHHVRSAVRSDAAERLSISIPIGLVSDQPVQYQRGSGESAINLKDVYWYERAELYPVIDVPKADLEVTVQALALGVVRHAVLRRSDGAERVVLGDFPPGRELVLFT